MANNTNHSAGRPQPARRRRRRQGVSVSLAIVLLIIAILMGGVVGFLISRRTDPTIHALQEANDRITELENTLTLIGFSEDTDDPEGWIYDDDAPEDDAGALSGSAADSGDDELWSEDSLLSGMLTDDGDPVVVAEFDGGQLLSSELIPEYNDQLTDQVFAGYSAEAVSDSLLQSVMDDMVSDRIIAARARELGLTELDEADLQQIGREAAEIYADQVAEYAAYIAEMGHGEGEEAPDEAHLRADAADYLEKESGVTLESVTEDLKEIWWMQKFFDHVVKDVTVSDEEVQTYYDELLADQQKAFAEYPEEFEFAHLNGDAIAWRPENYRAVRDILIPFGDDADEAADLMEQLELGTADESARARLDEICAPLEAAAGEALDKLNAGQSFESLMAEYGCSEELAEEPLRSEGFYLRDGSFVNSVEFVEGSLLLEQPGQISAPLRSVYGVHLAQYIGDVPAGQVPLEEIRDAVRAEALELKQSEYYEHQRQAMLEQANVKYYPDRLH